MNRYKITLSDNTVMSLYYKDEQTAREKNPNLINIELDNDYSFAEYCEKIIKNSNSKRKDYRGRNIWITSAPDCDFYVRLYKDPIDEKWYDHCEYQAHYKNQYTLPITYTMSTPKEFWNKCILSYIEPIEFELISFRKYGEPKLTKPNELKGIKQFGSIYFIPNKCKYKYYIKDNDIYVQHRDYFSPSYYESEDIGTPLSYRAEKYGLNKKVYEKFCYSDTWGDIVLRQEAWIKINNIIPKLNNFTSEQLSRLICEKQKEYHNFSDNLESYWYNFYENLINELKTLDI